MLVSGGCIFFKYSIQWDCYLKPRNLQIVQILSFKQFNVVREDSSINLEPMGSAIEIQQH